MSDQHNKSVLGCAGDGVVRTPNLDALAARGVQFTDCYAAAPLCVPSRMSFMTSRLPSRNRVWSETPLAAGTPTLAHVMALAGYETALIGRMHFIGPDQRHGFEKRPIGEFTARYPGTLPKGGKPWQHYPGATAGQFRKGLEYSGHGHTFYQYFDQQVTDAACRYLEEKRRDRSRPFFAVVGMVLPHCPYIAPKELFDYYFDRVSVPSKEVELPESVEEFRRVRGLIDPPITPHRTQVARAAYYGLTEILDRNVGKILAALDDNGLAEDTLVLYLSDHGDMLGEHGCWWKSMYYEGSVGVPFIAAGPGVAGGGRRCRQPASLMDIGPTVFELAEARHVHSHDGRSLLRCLREPVDVVDPDRMIISEMVDIRRDSPPVASRMIRRGEWKIWRTYGERGYSAPALFNLAEDPNERVDLGRSMAAWWTRTRLLRSLHRGWTPQRDRAAAAALRADLVDVIQRYGRLVAPECADTLAFPDEALEDDVVIIGEQGNVSDGSSLASAGSAGA